MLKHLKIRYTSDVVLEIEKITRGENNNAALFEYSYGMITESPFSFCHAFEIS